MPMHHKRIETAAAHFAPDLRRNDRKKSFRLIPEAGAFDKAGIVAGKKIDIPLHRLPKCSGRGNREPRSRTDTEP